MDVEVNVREHILKPVNEVFAAVVDPAKMTRYFISRASGPIKQGTTVEWGFADVGAKGSIDVIEVDENRRIVFGSAPYRPTSRVTIEFWADDHDTTVVTINESAFPMDHEGVQRAMGQTAG